MRVKRCLFQGFFVLAAVFLSVNANAFINPNFTPVDMVKQSDLVLLLEFKSVDKDGKAVAEIKQVLKGETKEKELVMDVMAGAFEDQGKDFMARINGGIKQAIIFIGMFKVEGIGTTGEEESAAGFLHYGDQYSDWRWAGFKKGNKNIWNMEKVENYLLGTWSGSTEMLLKAVNYIQTEPDAVLAINAGAEWKNKVKIGIFPGKTVSVRSVDLLGNGKPDVFISSDAGDRLLRFNGKTFDDITAKLNLRSASVFYAWGDLNGDGKPDLISWNGKTLNMYLLKTDGSFEEKACDTGTVFKDGCMSLSLLDLGEKMRAVILAGTASSPALLFTDGNGLKTESLPPLQGNKPGQSGHCLALDFDGDGISDIVQLFEESGAFYRGKGAGKFEAPVQTLASTGRGKYGVALADFDANGLMDIFVACDDKCRIWHNIGGGKFVELLKLSGEISYIAKAGGIDAATGDINNDGLQDVFVAYSNIPAQIFFNRGFRSFGHARELNIDGILPESEKGQLSGCFADFNGDGAEDLAVMLLNGETWLITRKVDGKALSVTAALPVSGAYNGPVNVSAWRDKRCLGTWGIRSGEQGAFFGIPEAGPIILKWTMPDGKPQEKEVVIKNGPIRVIIK